MTLAPGGTTPAVLWGAGSRVFALRSSSPDVLARAASVFQPWRASGADATASWTVSPVAEGWRVVRDQGPAAVPASGLAPELASMPGPVLAATPVLIRGDVNRVVSFVEFQAVLSLVQEPPDTLMFHAALVASGRAGVMLVGPNEAGKSTLACGLWLHGFSLLGDDGAVVEEGRRLRSSPRRVGLRASSRALLGEDVWSRLEAAPATEATGEGFLFHPHEVDGRSRPDVVALAACVFLARRGAMARIGSSPRRVPDAEATLALLPYASLIRRQPLDVVIPRLAPIAATVPMYDLPRGPLPAMVAAIERLVEQHG